MASQGSLLNAKFAPPAVTAIRAAAAREGVSISSLIRTFVLEGLVAIGIDPDNPPPIPERRSAIVRRAPSIGQHAAPLSEPPSPLLLPSAHVSDEATSPAPNDGAQHHGKPQ